MQLCIQQLHGDSYCTLRILHKRNPSLGAKYFNGVCLLNPNSDHYTCDQNDISLTPKIKGSRAYTRLT